MCKFSLVRSALHIKPAFCNCQLSCPWERHCREGMVGSYTQEVGIGGEGRVRRLFRIHESAHRSL